MSIGLRSARISIYSPMLWIQRCLLRHSHTRAHVYYAHNIFNMGMRTIMNVPFLTYSQRRQVCSPCECAIVIMLASDSQTTWLHFAPFRHCIDTVRLTVHTIRANVNQSLKFSWRWGCRSAWLEDWYTYVTFISISISILCIHSKLSEWISLEKLLLFDTTSKHATATNRNVRKQATSHACTRTQRVFESKNETKNSNSV